MLHIFLRAEVQSEGAGPGPADGADGDGELHPADDESHRPTDEGVRGEARGPPEDKETGAGQWRGHGGQTSH